MDKRPVGRPRDPANENRGPSLTIYFDDDDQRKRFKEKAVKAGMGFREYAESVVKKISDK